MEKIIEETSIKLEFLEQKKLNNLLYVGVDVHKDQHTALAVNCFSQILWEKEINNSKEEFCQLVKQIKNWQKARDWSRSLGWKTLPDTD